MRGPSILLVAGALIGLLPAQENPLSGPMEGFAFDAATKSLRPILGSLGSASLGAPIFGGVTYASVAPHQNYALAFQGDHCVLVSAMGSDQVSILKLDGSFTVPEGVAWSGDGSTAILFSRTENWLQVLSGLPNAVHPGPMLSLSLLGGSLSAVTADLHGDHVAIGIAGDTAGVYQLAGGAFSPLLSIARPTALAFSEDGKTLYALDTATNQLFEQNVSDLSSRSWPLDSIHDAIAIGTGHDAALRAVIYVVGQADRSVTVYDASTHEVLNSLQLGFEPSRMEPLGRNSFLLASRQRTDDTLWSFTNSPRPAAYFIPALPVQVRENRHR
jgi:hypothetical protein